MKDFFGYLHDLAAERGWSWDTTLSVICNFLQESTTPVSGITMFKVEDLVHYMENLPDAEDTDDEGD